MNMSRNDGLSSCRRRLQDVGKRNIQTVHRDRQRCSVFLYSVPNTHARNLPRAYVRRRRTNLDVLSSSLNCQHCLLQARVAYRNDHKRLSTVCFAQKKQFKSFDDMLSNETKPVLVDFYATWCTFK